MPRLSFWSSSSIKKIRLQWCGDDGLMWSYDGLGTSGFFFHNNIQASMSEDGFSFSGGGEDGLRCDDNDILEREKGKEYIKIKELE